jgi:hypothetical protein
MQSSSEFCDLLAVDSTHFAVWGLVGNLTRQNLNGNIGYNIRV